MTQEYLPLPPWIAKASGFVERYVLAAMYFYLAWQGLQQTWSLLRGWPPAEGWWSLPSVALAREASLMLIQLFIAGFLLLGRSAAVAPKRMIDVILPLAVSTFFLTYSAVRLAPPEFRTSLLRGEAQIVCSAIGICVGGIGGLIAVWGVVSLGRSFGIFVAVRKVVVKGAYRYVRHPIYLGYLFIWAGIILVNQSIAILGLVWIHTVLMVCRARLEEARLREASEEYRRYAAQTGFLFPRAG